VLPAACSKPCHAMPMRCEPVVCLTLPPLRLHTHSWAGLLHVSLLASLQQISRTCCERYRYRTTLQHSLLAYRHPSFCFGRQARVCISLVRECIRGPQGGPACYLSKPILPSASPWCWGRIHMARLPPRRANTALSPALRLLIDGMQLAF
jgi:hypothetical protein